MSRLLCLLVVGWSAVTFRPAVLAVSPAADAAHLVLSYRCLPQNRPPFHAYMATSGVRRFEQWKHDHVIADYHILFGAVVNEAMPDMWVFLDFSRTTDLAKWWEIEQINPGGLTAEALAWAHPIASVCTDALADAPAEAPAPPAPVFMVIPYQTLVPAGQYEAYVEHYVVPQLRAWAKSGLVRGFRVLRDQNPAGTVWDSLLVIEYTDARALGQRETLKTAVRDSLKSDAEFQHFAGIKSTIRKEGQPGTYLAISPPAETR